MYADCIAWPSYPSIHTKASNKHTHTHASAHKHGQTHICLCRCDSGSHGREGWSTCTLANGMEGSLQGVVQLDFPRHHSQPGADIGWLFMSAHTYCITKKDHSNVYICFGGHAGTFLFCVLIRYEGFHKTYVISYQPCCLKITSLCNKVQMWLCFYGECNSLDELCPEATYFYSNEQINFEYIYYRKLI